MRIHVSFIDRVGITQEVLALLGARNLNLDAVEMVPPNVYIDAPPSAPPYLKNCTTRCSKYTACNRWTWSTSSPASAATCSSMPCWPP